MTIINKTKLRFVIKRQYDNKKGSQMSVEHNTKIKIKIKNKKKYDKKDDEYEK